MVTVFQKVQEGEEILDETLQDAQSQDLQSVDQFQSNEDKDVLKTEITLKKKKAQTKMTRYSFTKSRRTKTQLYNLLKLEWQKKFESNKFFKYRVISRRYMRKLSAETQPEQSPSMKRKISWDEQIEVVVFSKNQKPKAINNCPRRKDILFSNQVITIS